MSLTASEVWTRLLDRARQELSEQTFRTWLEPTEALSLDGSNLVVGTHDQFAADWNDSKHALMLEGYAAIVVGYPISVQFRVHEERRQRPQMDLFVQTIPRQNNTPVSSQQRYNYAPLSGRYTFAQFVVGKSNELAAAAAAAVAQAPGKIYNPLFLYGATGLGKTHLMQAVGHEILSKNAETRVAFLGAEQFTNEYVVAIQTRSTHDFRRRYREVDLLLVDDVQFLKGKEATQEEYFHTFNALYEAGRQIIMTSDRSPADIAGLEQRLVTRFQWGMVADIEHPDLEHRIAILRQKAIVDHLEHTISDEVIRFVAEHVHSSIRELEGSIIKLLAYASLKHRDITLEIAQEALRDKLRDSSAFVHSKKQISVEYIQEVVAQAWGVTTEGLKSKTRTKILTVPRQLAMLLCRELLGLQLIEIGNAFGNRDHSTVIHSLDRAHKMIKNDPQVADRIAMLRRTLTQ